MFIYYTIVVAIGAFHVHEATHSSGLLALSFVIVLMSGLCVAASVFLLVGLSVVIPFKNKPILKDCKQMLLPWICIILMTTLFDILYTVLWLLESFRKEKKEENHYFVVLVIDIIMCAFNFYGIICVVSQYQIYRQQSVPQNKNILPPIEFRLIQFQNSREKSDKTNEKNENCLKVPKLFDSSSGSSAVEDISDGSLLTTIDEKTDNNNEKQNYVSNRLLVQNLSFQNICYEIVIFYSHIRDKRSS
ncbi:unnamed protein product [Medioppia subpectinata]|uniref:Uncharacterized protein n=1 Tax=Medioppia subpectinata TaxID=1979941 RepID=A0A7R9L1Q1_9ACAR|nr:unnamed protein product [Medioppia subpectinata]CAG2112697.1 unnamed protein product [Medioppia subpectinata]